MVIFVVAVSLPAALTAGAGFAADSTTSTVTPPPGALKPVPATGMGTPAAMDDPRCNVGTGFSVYGNWNTGTVGTGPACVRPMKKGEKNGGATAPGVTADSVKVVAVIPSPGRSAEQTKAAPPILRAGNSPSSWENAVHDYLYAYHNFYEQWGRAIDVEFYTSTGIDETAQRADVVAISAMKPFAVINFDTLRARRAGHGPGAEEDPGAELLDVAGGVGGAGAVPLGRWVRPGRGGDERGRGHRQEPRRQAGRVRRQRCEEPDPQVRAGRGEGPHRPRRLQEEPRQVQGHDDRQRVLVPGYGRRGRGRHRRAARGAPDCARA